MKLMPVKNYKPHYPHRDQVDLKYLLLTHRPKRWKKSGAILILGTLASIGLSGCGNSPVNDPGLIMGDMVQEIRKMNMAPLFEIPPQTVTEPGNSTPLSEEMAFAIIQSELERLGLSAETSQYKVMLPVNDQPGANYQEWSIDMEISGARDLIYAEFLPQTDAEYLRELEERKALNLPENTKEAAVMLNNRLSDAYDNSTGVVFYAHDMVPCQEQDLRAQVVDFVQWLKTMGLV